jgi:hypothetical protein
MALSIRSIAKLAKNLKKSKVTIQKEAKFIINLNFLFNSLAFIVKSFK